MNRWLGISIASHLVVGVFLFAFAGESKAKLEDLPTVQISLYPGPEMDEVDPVEEVAEETPASEEPAPNTPEPDSPPEPTAGPDEAEEAPPVPTPPPVIVKPTKAAPVVVSTPKPAATKKSTPKPTPALKPTVNRQVAKLKAVENKIRERQREFQDKKDRLANLSKQRTSPGVKGPVKRPGSLDPDAIYRLENTYFDKVNRAIKRNWRTPTIRAGILRKAEIIIQIEQSGSISGTQWVGRSGDPTFDNSIMDAIRITILEPIPADVGKTRLKVGIVFEDIP